MTVSDLDPLPGQTFTLAGDGDDCPASESGAAGTFVATLTYRTPAGITTDLNTTGSVAADGTFSSSVTLPETAASNAPTDIISSTTCAGTTTESNRVTLKVLYHPGTLSLSANSVSAGGTITASGGNCYGGEFLVVYGPSGSDPGTFDDGKSGVPGDDRSFRTTLTIPAAQSPGRYVVYAFCPGTDFTEIAMTVNAGSVSPTASAPVTASSAPATVSASSAPATVSASSASPTVSASPVIITVVSPTATASSPSSTTTLGGGFTGQRTGGTTSGTTPGTTSGIGTTPVATAPVAVRGEATFTG